MNFSKSLEKAKDFSEIFSLVKFCVRRFLGKERTGLILGLAELGGNSNFFIGALHPVGSNFIILNKTPLKIVRAFRPELYNAYCFVMLLHEYLHSIGILDEREVRYLTSLICEKTFGQNHPTSLISKDLTSIFPEIIFASQNWKPREISEIEIVKDFEKENLNYIG
jgi:hypothetical protein